MFYHVAKIGWFVVEPSNLLALLTLAGVGLSYTSLRRSARLLASLGIIGLLTLGFSPMANWLILPLEMRFPVPPLEGRQIDGIIVLGGAVQERQTVTHGPLALNDAGDRVTALVALANRFPQARVLFTGGAGVYSAAPKPEAEVLRDHIVSLGLAEGRVQFESNSVDTYQNAVFSRDLMRPKAGETWLLVTSAWHMPRAVGCFRQAGFAVLAYPVDFRTGGWGDRLRGFSSLSDGLRRTEVATREWLGLAVYRLSGRSNAWLPGP
jgi:uncharacterized SAM-binding protein YcdF (DUF218 family)